MAEFEGKRLLAAAGIPTPEGFVIERPEEALGLPVPYPVAVKAQVRRGGRGKAGGVLRAEDPRAAVRAAERILGQAFGDESPSAVLLEPWLSMEREIYLSVAVDGKARGFSVLYSPAGGIDVEGATPPVRCPVGLPRDFRAHALRKALIAAEDDPSLREKIVLLARALLRLAQSQDCLTVEINPLALLPDGSLVAADAKVVRDDAAAFRNPQIRAGLLAEYRKEPGLVERCLRAGLMLVRLGGDVGLISGGAGMTMAAMDLIKHAGGEPACFLDCSANPTPAGYRLAFEMLDSAPEVRAILVSIFGGATHMDRVARVMRDIMQERASQRPVVFRLDGTNADAAREILREAGLHNHPALEAAVAEAVACAGARA